MLCRWWISLGLILCVSIPALARAGDWSPLAGEMQWSYAISGVNKLAIAGMQQSQRVRGTRTVEVRDVRLDHPESPYELLDTRVTRSDGETGESRKVLRMWLRKDKQGLFDVAEEFANPFQGGVRQMVHYSPALKLLPPDPEAGQTWDVGVLRVVGLHIKLTGKVLGLRDVETPAGRYTGCLEVQYSGPITGQLESPEGPLPIRSGSARLTSIFAPGIGTVVEQEHFELRMRVPDGPVIRSVERNRYELVSSTLLPGAPANAAPSRSTQPAQ